MTMTASDQDRQWVRWVILLLAALQVAVFVADVAQPQIILFSYLNLPVLLTIGLGRPRLTAVFSVSAVALGLVTAQDNDYFASGNGWARFLMMSLVCASSIGLSMVVQRSRAAQQESRRLLQQEHDRLKVAEARFRLLATTTSDVVLQVDPDSVIEWVSPAVTDVLGWDPSGLIGVRSRNLVHRDDVQDLLSREAAENRAGRVMATFRVRRKDGSYCWVEAVADALPAPGQGWVVRVRDVEDQMRDLHDLQDLAARDPLTGLLNRRGAGDRLDAAFGERRSGRSAAVLFADLDEFKQINDLHGHEVGDTVLRTTADRISGLLRDSDFVIRVGGDELLVVLEGVHDSGEAVHIAERIRERCAAPIRLGGHGQVVSTLSIGVALARDGEHADQVIHRADAALYEAKSKGRDTVSLAAG